MVWHGYPARVYQGHLGRGATDLHGQDGRATHGRDVHATLCGHNATGSAPAYVARPDPAPGPGFKAITPEVDALGARQKSGLRFQVRRPGLGAFVGG